MSLAEWNESRSIVGHEFLPFNSIESVDIYTAFRILAGYIFGDNEKKQEITMITPVVQKPTTESEKLPMTAPVIQSPNEQGWVMAFMMPSAYKNDDRDQKDTRATFANNRLNLTAGSPVA